MSEGRWTQNREFKFRINGKKYHFQSNDLQLAEQGIETYWRMLTSGTECKTFDPNKVQGAQGDADAAEAKLIDLKKKYNAWCESVTEEIKDIVVNIGIRGNEMQWEATCRNYDPRTLSKMFYKGLAVYSLLCGGGREI